MSGFTFLLVQTTPHLITATDLRVDISEDGYGLFLRVRGTVNKRPVTVAHYNTNFRDRKTAEARGRELLKHCQGAQMMVGT